MTKSLYHISTMLVLFLMAFLLLSSTALAADAPTSGTLPDSGQTWVVTGTTLTITGEGRMEYFRNKEDVPWASFAGEITEVKLDERLTSVSEYAFQNFSKLKTIDLPAGLTSIGTSAFRDCSSLERIEIPKEVAWIGGSATFWGCKALKEAVFYGDSFEQLDNLFSDSPDVTVKGYARSRSCLMAHLNNYRWESLGESPELETVYLTPGDSLWNYARRSHTRIILGDGIYDTSITIEACDIRIEPEHPGKVELLSRSDDIPVIKILNTGFVDLSGLILGHRESSTEDEEGACGAGIISSYSDSSKAQVISVGSSLLVNIDRCDLWGCGLNAVFLSNSKDSINVTDSILRDCVYGAVYARRSGALFQNCVISGNAYHEGLNSKPCIYSDTADSLRFENCRFLCNTNPLLVSSEESATFMDCDFRDNVWQGGTPGSYGVCLGGVVWEVKDNVLYLDRDHTFEDGTVLLSEGEDIPNYSVYSQPWKHWLIDRIADYCEVTFVPNGGYLPYEVDPGTCARIVAVGQPYGALPEARSSDGYEFLGWWTEKSGGERIESDTIVDSTEPQTLYAHWKFGGTLMFFNWETGVVTPSDINWSVGDDGTVYFLGQGEMPGFETQIGLKTKLPYHSVVIGEGITSIGDHSFLDCEALTAVYLPKSLRQIGYSAFGNCEILADVYYHGTEEEWKAVSIFNYWAEDQFAGVTIHNNSGWGSEIRLPGDLVQIEDEAFAGLKYNVYIIPGCVSTISPTAFDPTSTLHIPAGSSAAAAAAGLNVSIVLSQ